MPKLKTNKSVKKRFRVTKKGKVVCSKAKRRHLLTDKSSGKKRGLRNKVTINRTEGATIKKLLPYG